MRRRVDEKLVASRVKAVSDLQAAEVRARADRRLALRKLLTPEQQQKLRQLTRERSARARRPRGAAPGRDRRRAGSVRSAALALAIGSAAATRDETTDGLATSERELVRACQAGDRAAFDRLVERHQRDVYRLCYR